MHPAYSVIFFTVGSGAGYGLLILFALFAFLGLLPQGLWFGLITLALALGLITAGLLSSTFHLGHPERSWRAFSQWRSSWLSREGVVSVATYPVAGLFGLGWLFFPVEYDNQVGVEGAFAAAALATVVLSGVTVFCTSMIYASLKTIHQWRNKWVAPGYLVYGLMTGALWFNAIAHLFGVAGPLHGWLVMIAVAIGLLLKLGYWRFIDANTGRATPESATGLGQLGRVRPLDPPHTQENYLQREMGFRVARKHAGKLRRFAVLFAFVLPLVLVSLGFAAPALVAGALAVLAALCGMIGLLVERWLFFAQARHTVMLYYGADRS